MSELGLLFEFAKAIWFLWFIACGWLCSILPVLFFQWELTVDQLYWIGIISFPILMVLNVIGASYLERRNKEYHELKEKYTDIIPVIDTSIEVENQKRKNGG